MGLNLFKKRTTPEPEVIEKIIEKVVEVPVEVEKPSRFTFAYDDTVVVKRFNFIGDVTTKCADLLEGTVFAHPILDNDNILYYIFKLPNVLPSTRLVTPKKISCLGSIIVDRYTNEIKGVTSDFVGTTLDNFISIGAISADVFTEESGVIVMNKEDVISETVNCDDIDYNTFVQSIIVENRLDSVLNQN